MIKKIMYFKLMLLLAFGIFVGALACADTLTIEESVAYALEHNPKMRIANENIRKAQAVVRETTSHGMPKLSIEGTYQRVDKVPKAEFGGAEISLGSLENRTADLVLTQPIDIFGAIRTGRDASRLGQSAAQIEYEQTVNEVILDVKMAYYNALRAQGYLKVQEDTIAQIEAHLRDAKAHFNEGTIANFEVLRAETQLANANQGYIAAKNGIKLAKSAFNNTLGRPLDAEVNLVAPENNPEFADFDLQSCINIAMNHRPEVLKAREYVEMSETMVRAARLSGMPRVNLRWAYNKNFDTSMFNPDSTSWRAFLTASIPIYDGGATRAAVGKASSDLNNAQSMYEQAVQGITLDVQSSYLTIEETKERIKAAQKGLEQARESMRLAQVRYKGGVSTQLEIMDSQSALTLAEANYVNSFFDFQTALAKLERAVGGQEQFAKLIEGGVMVAGD